MTPASSRATWFRSALWVFGGVAAAIAAGILTSAAPVALPALPAGVATFGPSIASALVLALVFARHPAEGIGAYLLLDLVAITVAHWFSIDYRVIDEAFVVMLVALVLVQKPTLLSRRPGRQEAAVGIFIIAGILSSLVSAVPGDTWIPAALLLLKGIAFYYAVRSVDLGIAQVERVSGVILVAASVILVLGFIEFIDPAAFQSALGLPSFSLQRGELPVVKSIFLHPALYGWLPAYISLFLYARFAVVRSWWALALGLLFNVGTLLSFRRRPWLGIVAGLTVGALAEWRRAGWARPSGRRFAVGFSILAVLAILVAPVVVSTTERTIAEYFTRGNPLEILADDPQADLVAPTQPRVALYVGAIAITRDHFPFGAGLGRYGSFISGVNYSPVYAQYGMDRVTGLVEERPVAITDTFWPMVLGETGIIGLLAMGAFLVMILARLLRITTQSRTVGVHAFALGAVAVFVEGLVGSTTASTFVAAPIAFWVFGAAAVAEALMRSESSDDYGAPAASDSSMIRQASSGPNQPKTSTGRPSSSL